jgi:hypothetical protein
MEPLNLPGMTTFIKEGCFDLPGFVTTDGRVVTVWKPTDAELAVLYRGGHIILHVWAKNGVPPQAIEVSEDFIEKPEGA